MSTTIDCMTQGHTSLGKSFFAEWEALNSAKATPPPLVGEPTKKWVYIRANAGDYPGGSSYAKGVYVVLHDKPATPGDVDVEWVKGFSELSSANQPRVVYPTRLQHVTVPLPSVEELSEEPAFRDFESAANFSFGVALASLVASVSFIALGRYLPLLSFGTAAICFAVMGIVERMIARSIKADARSQ
ncbi:MAG TPA: hypothetical protein VM165_20765 [Planctomycetaceae bacterium]|nr:hypothetical protein [Planctomycetaceae bacterium]